MGRTKDIMAAATPVLVVVVVAVSAFYRPPPPKPKPDRILVVCSYETPDDRSLTYVVPGKDCSVCRRHPLFTKNGGDDMELTGCYRQVQRGAQIEGLPPDQEDPRWTAAEKEASACDALPAKASACEELKTHSFACRRQCHRDPDCAAMCRTRCDVATFCPKPSPSREAHQSAPSSAPPTEIAKVDS